MEQMQVIMDIKPPLVENAQTLMVNALNHATLPINITMGTALRVLSITQKIITLNTILIICQNYPKM